LTHVDLSNNALTHLVAEQIADDYKVLTTSGKIKNKKSRSTMRRISFSNNPDIGRAGSTSLVKSFSSESMEHIELANIGAGPRAAEAIANSLRNVTVGWKYVDVSGNYFSRIGLNKILWAVRRNRRLQTVLLGNNEGGPLLGTEEDNYFEHGIALPRAVQENITIRFLDFSYNGLSPEAGRILFTALTVNMSIQKLSVRGNLLDDTVSVELTSLLQKNDVIQDMDLGENELGYRASFAIAEGLLTNRSLRILYLDKNKLGVAGSATVESFFGALSLNMNLRILNLDGNRLGSTFGIKLGQSLSRTGSLLYISMLNNRLDSRAGEVLLRAYRHNPYLSELRVTEEEVGSDIYLEMQRVYHKKRAQENHDGRGGAAAVESLVDRYRSSLFSNLI